MLEPADVGSFARPKCKLRSRDGPITSAMANLACFAAGLAAQGAKVLGRMFTFGEWLHGLFQLPAVKDGDLLLGLAGLGAVSFHLLDNVKARLDIAEDNVFVVQPKG